MSERNESSDDDWDPSPETNTGMLANPMKVEFTDQVIRKNIQEQEGFGDGQEGTEFYGVLLDEDDEAWVKKKYQPGGKGDILSCPYCFTQISYDYQAHEQYLGQYRSQQAVNCIVEKNKPMKIDQVLSDDIKKSYKKTEKDSFAYFFPVKCKNCDTEVAYLEYEESVFHFYNALPGFG